MTIHEILIEHQSIISCRNIKIYKTVYISEISFMDFSVTWKVLYIANQP